MGEERWLSAIPLPSLYSYKSVAKGGRSVGAAGLCRADPLPFYAFYQPFLPTFLAAGPGEPELVYSAACSIECLEQEQFVLSGSTGFRSFRLPRREEKGARSACGALSAAEEQPQAKPVGKRKVSLCKNKCG